MNRRRVVITGLGAVTPVGLTADESWQAVKNGVCGVAPITAYDPAEQKVKLAAEVKGFVPEEHLGKQEAKRMGRYPEGRRPHWKKAMVTLTADSKSIEFFEGMV